MSPSSSSSWTFRPSVLQESNYHQLTVDQITEYYIRDNDRAAKEGVVVPPHPSENQESSLPLALRTAQWNIQAWRSPTGKPVNPKDIQGVLRQVNADVIILNEYHWNDRNHHIHTHFERFLRFQGYQQCYCGTNGTPTLVASKYAVLEFKEITLSYERSALCLKLDLPSRPLWVIGTHLDHLDGSQRQFEMKKLLQTISQEFHKDDPIILAGDFNQQRQQDYPKKEWQRIEASMAKRKACRDDGVGALLEKQNFRCAFDQLLQQQQPHCKNYNWETSSHPPSTHWSGTTIDYSYSRNIPVQGVYISPAGYSDHRMTVCDWTVPRGTVRRVSAKAASITTATTTSMELWNDSDDDQQQHMRTTTTHMTASAVTASAAAIATWIADDTSSSAGSM